VLEAASRRRSPPSGARGQSFRQRQLHDLRRPPAEDIAAFLDLTEELGVGVSISPGYAYERAPDQQHFLNRRKTKELFRNVFALGKGKKWNLTHSDMFLDFLAGNQEFHCTPWGMPTRNIFGWQKPCYLLGEGYAKTYKELMETTDWDSYGTGAYEKCANCMAHCGYEPTAAEATAQRPRGSGARLARREDGRADGAEILEAGFGAVCASTAKYSSGCRKSEPTRRARRPPRNRRGPRPARRKVQTLVPGRSLRSVPK
jgi:hypothetical protein